MMTRAMETFDDIVAKYDENPVSFIEGIWRGKFEYPVADDPYCVSCRSWGELTGRSILVLREDHKPEKLGDNPSPHHRFERHTIFYPLRNLTQEQLIEQIQRFERKHWDADLLKLYLREKFTNPKARPIEQFLNRWGCA